MTSEKLDGVAPMKSLNQTDTSSTAKTSRSKFKILMYRNFDGEFYFFIINSGRRVAVSNFYTTKDWCEKSAKKMQKHLKCTITFTDLRSDYE